MSKESKELREIVKNAQTQGWRVERARNGHWKFYSPNGRDLIVEADTPSDWRGRKNFLSRMRRAGFKEDT